MKKIFFSAVIIFLILIAGFAITKFFNNSSNFIHSGNIIYETDNLPQNKYASFKNNLIIATTTKTFCINKNGSILWEHSAFCVNPKLEVSGQYIMVADINGKNIYILKNGNLVLQKSFDNSIFNASINKSGYLTVSTAAEGYSSKVTVYNQFGDEIYYYCSSEDFAIDAKLAPNNRNLAISFYGTKDGEILASICFIDITAQKVLERPAFVNLIISDLMFNNNGNLLAIGDTAALYYNKKGEKRWVCKFNSQIMANYAFNENKNFSLIFKNVAGTATIKTYNFRNKFKKEKEIDFYPKIISKSNKNSLLIGDRKFIILGQNGALSATNQLSKNYSSVVFSNNNKFFYGVSNFYIELVKLK